MKELFAQIRDNCPACKIGFGEYFLPFNDEDREKAKAYKLFQVVKLKVSGFKKERSLKQLGLYWAACGWSADNTDNKQWNTKEKVDFHCRVEAHFVNPDLVVVKPDGSVQFCYRSIAFKTLEHVEACNYFDRAFQTMTDFYNATHKEKITVDEFIELVKESMRGKYVSERNTV